MKLSDILTEQPGNEENEKNNRENISTAAQRTSTLTTKQIAAKKGVSASRIRQLKAEGKLKNVGKSGNSSEFTVDQAQKVISKKNDKEED